MWNSLARSPLVTCLIHDKWLCEKPWMKRISGPLGLPQTCAEMVRPSGVFTETAWNFFSCAMAGAESAPTSSAAAEMPAKQRKIDACDIVRLLAEFENLMVFFNAGDELPIVVPCRMMPFVSP